MEDQRYFVSLHQNGEITDACMTIIAEELNLAIDSLERDQRGDFIGRDRALQLSEAANTKRKKLGCL